MSDAFAAVRRAGVRHLKKNAPEFAPVIAAVGPCTFAPEADVFRVLVGSVVAQLISTVAARTIRDRIVAKAGGRITTGSIAKLTVSDLRACGVSGAKARALLGMAAHFRANRGFARKLYAADDDTARRMLLPLSGVGPWTVDMVLMFSLGRPDILPVGDFGLRAGVRDLYGLPDLLKPAALTALAEPWRPYRSIATWYLWKSRGWVPQSEGE